MTLVTITTLEHYVYEYEVDVPDANAPWADIDELISDGCGWPDGTIRECTLREIVDVRPA